MEARVLSETCPECGAALVVMEELQASMIVANGQVAVPVTHPTCVNGHDYVPSGGHAGN